MKLIKDLIHGRIVYYWLGDNHKKISPDLKSFTLAEEWYIRYLNESYQGINRRTSWIDRRKLHGHRKKTENIAIIPTDPYGRRKTDKPIKVDRDLAAQKLEELIKNYDSYDTFGGEDE